VLVKHLQSSLKLHQLPECERHITGTCILSGAVHQIRCIWSNALMFAIEWLSETKILVNIGQRKDVSCKGCRASIAHPWAVPDYHQFALKSMLHNMGLHWATSSLVHSQNFPCSGLTWAALPCTLKMNARRFAVLCTQYWLMQCTLVYRDFCVHQWYINLVLILLYGFIFFLFFNERN
jgi:hypothetical protein